HPSISSCHLTVILSQAFTPSSSPQEATVSVTNSTITNHTAFGLEAFASSTSVPLGLILQGDTFSSDNTAVNVNGMLGSSSTTLSNNTASGNRINGLQLSAQVTGNLTLAAFDPGLPYIVN